MTYRTLKICCVLLFYCFMAFISVRGTLAQSSTHYDIKQSVIAQGGMASSSVGYGVNDVIGQASPLGRTASDNYIEISGFLASFAIIPPDDRHFIPVWTGNPIDSMNVWCLQASLFEEDLIAGDEIGVFDGTLCVGAVLLDRSPSHEDPVQIICSKDDGSGNGFTEGNPIFFKVWDASESEEYSAAAEYFDCQSGDPADPVPFQSLESACVELAAPGIITQAIPLITNWNMFSLAVSPEGSHDMMDIVQPLIDSGHLVKVIDEGGRTIEFLLGSWRNTIGDWFETEGYYIKVSSDVTFEVSGLEIVTPLTIPLLQNWNMISYPCYQSAQDALDVFQQLIDAGELIKVIDERGRTVEYLLGSWRNTIGDMVPGEGFYVKVTTNTSLVVSCGTPSLLAKAKDIVEMTSPSPKHFIVGEENVFEPMNIYLTKVAVDGLDLLAGDEVGIFDGDICVGAGVIEGEVSAEHPLSIVARKADGSDIGFENGNEVSVRIWQVNKGKEISVVTSELAYLDSQRGTPIAPQTFAGLSTAVLEVNCDISSRVKEVVIPTEYHLYQNHPNPFNPTTAIRYAVPKSSTVTLTIYSLIGQEITTLVNKPQPAGYHEIQWNAGNLPSGMYLCRMQAGEFVQNRKLLLIK